MKVSEVFVPGGLPKYTYVPRAERGLEDQLSAAKDNLCKIATVTGATKSGKTVLVRKVFGDAANVWVDGGHVKTEQDFWNIVGTQLEVVSELERSNICYKSGFRERPNEARSIVRDFDYGIIFREVARDLGRSIYDKLAGGPRQRSDRLPRLLKNGKSEDIYKVVLRGLAYLKPGVETVE
jgi:hypothetical protein